MPERKTLNEDLFYRGSSANLPRLHTCKNKVPFWDFSQFAVTLAMIRTFSYDKQLQKVPVRILILTIVTDNIIGTF